MDVGASRLLQLFAPLYVLVVLCEKVVRALGLSRLAGYLVVSAER